MGLLRSDAVGGLPCLWWASAGRMHSARSSVKRGGIDLIRKGVLGVDEGIDGGGDSGWWHGLRMRMESLRGLYLTGYLFHLHALADLPSGLILGRDIHGRSGRNEVGRSHPDTSMNRLEYIQNAN